MTAFRVIFLLNYTVIIKFIIQELSCGRADVPAARRQDLPAFCSRLVSHRRQAVRVVIILVVHAVDPLL